MWRKRTKWKCVSILIVYLAICTISGINFTEVEIKIQKSSDREISPAQKLWYSTSQLPSSFPVNESQKKNVTNETDIEIITAKHSNRFVIKTIVKKTLRKKINNAIISKSLNLSNKICSYLQYEKYKGNILFNDDDQINDKIIDIYQDKHLDLNPYSCNPSSYSYPPDSKTISTTYQTEAPKNSSDETEFLPPGCHFQNNNINTQTVICSGPSFKEVPKFILLNTHTLIFNDTAIMVLDKKSIMRLPRVTELVFANGALMRVDFQNLIWYQLELTYLLIQRNVITSFSFSNFYNENRHYDDKLKVLDLRRNSITFLPEPDGTNHTVLHKLESIVFSRNPIRVIPGNLFYPLRKSPVKYLSLRNAVIYSYGTPLSSANASSPLTFLPHLETLDLSGNPHFNEVMLAGFIEPLRNKSLNTLLLAMNNYISIPTQALDVVKSSLEFLDLQGSSLVCIDNASFPEMKHLKVLNLRYSRITEIIHGTFESMPSLQILHLDGNLLTTFPPYLSLNSLRVLTLENNPTKVSEDSKSFIIAGSPFVSFTNLEQLSLAKDPLYSVEKNFFVGLTDLKCLILSECSITHIEDSSFSDMSKLEVLHLDRNKLTVLTNNTFSGLSNLTYLSLYNNKISFDGPNNPGTDAHNVERQYILSNLLKVFNITRRPKKRDLVNKTIDNSNNVVPMDVFSKLVSLATLNLNKNRITDIYPQLFDEMVHLRDLDLGNNQIRDWDNEVFSHNDELKLLILSNNVISSFTDAMVVDMSKPNLTVDLRDNMFDCSCPLIAFNYELNNTFFVGRSSYQCFNGTDYLNVEAYIDTLEYPCVDSGIIVYPGMKNIYAIYGYIAGTLILFTILSFATYRNRWYVKYVAYKFSVKVRYMNSKPDMDKYDYDIFVSYAQPDRQWVFEHLINTLEKTIGLKVCVHERDFVVGEEITHNIIRSVEISRKVLVVISRSFVESEWCMFELKMASNKIFNERKNKLILLLLEAIPVDEQPKYLKLLMKSRTYIFWAPDIEGTRIFWARLFIAIAKPTFSDEQKKSEENESRVSNSSSTDSAIEEDSDFGLQMMSEIVRGNSAINPFLVKNRGQLSDNQGTCSLTASELRKENLEQNVSCRTELETFEKFSFETFSGDNQCSEI